MKCTQHRLHGQATFKNARTILFFKVGRGGREHGLHPGNEGSMPKMGPDTGQM
jgi:hypothetical protein